MHRLEKVRLDRQRADDAAREARLEQERERRQTERASLHKHGRPASAKTSRGGTPSTGGAKTTAGAPELDGEARRELERKERAARAKAKLFEGDEDDAPPVRTGSRKLAPPAGGSKGKGKAGKPRTPAGGHPADCSLIRLNTTPRDIRTISEVERDMLLRKMGSADVQMADPGDERALWADPRALAKALDRSRPRPPAAEEEAAVSPRRATPRPSQASPVAKSKTGQALASKKRSRPGSDDEPRKRRADEDYRDEIWAIMGKRRSAYVGLSEDEDDDMEAGATDLFDEEFRSWVSPSPDATVWCV